MLFQEDCLAAFWIKALGTFLSKAALSLPKSQFAGMGLAGTFFFFPGRGWAGLPFIMGLFSLWEAHAAKSWELFFSAVWKLLF